MNQVLVLGGSRMVGAAVVDEALDRGGEVVAFTRGESGPVHRVDELTWVRGDRRDPEALADLAARGPFDRVIDCSPQIPRDAVLSVRSLRDATPMYVGVSTITAVSEWPASPVQPDSPLHEGDPDAGEELEGYAQRKAGVERAIAREASGRSIAIRPGIILGAASDLDRLSRYVRRAMTGSVTLPGEPDRAFQCIDLRDLAHICLDARPGAPINAVGPIRTWGDLGDALVDVMHDAGIALQVNWIDDQELTARGVEVWGGEFPLWAPSDDLDSAYVFKVSGRARVDAQPARSFYDTVRRTLEQIENEG